MFFFGAVAHLALYIHVQCFGSNSSCTGASVTLYGKCNRGWLDDGRWVGGGGGGVGHKMIVFIAENEICVSKNMGFPAEMYASETKHLCFCTENAFRCSKTIAFLAET